MNPLTDLERRITARENSTNSVAAHTAYGYVLDDLAAVQATHTPEGGGALDAWLVEKIAKCDEFLVAQKPPLWLWHEWMRIVNKRDARITELARRIVEMEVRLGEHEWDARTDPAWGTPMATTTDAAAGTYPGGRHYGD